MLCCNNQTDQGDQTEGLEREGLERDGIGEGEIGIILCLSLTQKTFRITVPPALLDYIRSGTYSRIVFPNYDFSWGFL
jgi:hypothetical protein